MHPAPAPPDQPPPGQPPPTEPDLWEQRGFTMPNSIFRLLDEIVAAKPGWNKSHAVREAIQLLHRKVVTNTQP